MPLCDTRGSITQSSLDSNRASFLHPRLVFKKERKKERKKKRKERRKEGRKKERKEEWREERKKEKKNTAN